MNIDFYKYFLCLHLQPKKGSAIIVYKYKKFILTELEDAVGKENCSIGAIDKVSHSVD